MADGATILQLRLPGSARQLRLLEIVPWVLSIVPLSPPSLPPPSLPPPSPPPPRQNLEANATLSLGAALHDARSTHAGSPVLVSVTAGTHALSNASFDSSVTASEVWLQGMEGATLVAATDAPALTVGEPNASCAPIHLERLRLRGRIVVVAGGILFVDNCTFMRMDSSAQAVAGVTLGGGVLVAGGYVEMRGCRFVGLNATRGGAIAVPPPRVEPALSWPRVPRLLIRRLTLRISLQMTGGSLAVHDSELSSNSATRGGAVYASAGVLLVMGCLLERNEATGAGGAVYVSGAAVLLGNGTWLHANSAAAGRAAYLASGSLTYGMPSPLATWVTSATRCSAAQPEMCGSGWAGIPEDARGPWLGLDVHSIAAGAIDDDFPLSCTPGVYGDSLETADQSRPTCSGACPASNYCPRHTVIPLRCPAGSFCPLGVSAGVACPSGRYGAQPGLRSEQECSTCSPGGFCTLGATAVRNCTPGSFSAAGSGECEGCAEGAYQPSPGQSECVAGVRATSRCNIGK